jgi:hypothetical protein
MSTIYVLFFGVIGILFLKSPICPLNIEILTGIGRFYFLTLLSAATFGVVMHIVLGGMGFAGLIPFMLCGILGASIVWYFFVPGFFADIPALVMLSLQGAATGGAMWWQAQPRRPA